VSLLDDETKLLTSRLGWTLAAVTADMLGDVVAGGAGHIGVLRIQTN